MVQKNPLEEVKQEMRIQIFYGSNPWPVIGVNRHLRICCRSLDQIEAA